MKRPLAGLRLGVILLFMLGFLSPVASMGAGAQELTCDDFNSERAAQAVLDADPEMEDALDPDGNGVACDHEEDASDDDGGSARDDEEDATDAEDDGSSDDGASSGDGDAYLADIQDELDTLAEQFDRFLEIDSTIADATDAEAQEMVEEINDLAAGWVEYPDVAAEFEAPSGYEDVEDAFLDLADTVGEAGEAWETYWAIPAEDDEEEEIAFDAFNEAFISAQEQLDEVQTLVDDFGGSAPSDDATDDEDATDDATDEEDATDDESDDSGDPVDEDEYLVAVQDELDTLVDEADRADEILGLGGDATSADVEEINEIFAAWVEYPDVAADLVAPRGFEDVEDAYLDLADSVGETGELWEAYWDLDAGDPDEEDALLDFEESFETTMDLIDEVQDLVDDASGSSSGSDDATDDEDATDDATDEEDAADDTADESDDTDDASDGGDAQDYLDEVTEQSEEWNDSIARFNEIVSLWAAGDASDAEISELSEIVTMWLGAPEIASGADVPAGMEDVQEAYETYADTLAEAGTNFTIWLSAESGTAESEDALDDFAASIAESQEAYADLQDELAAAG